MSWWAQQILWLMLSYHYWPIFNSCSLSTQLYTYSSGTCGLCGSLILSKTYIGSTCLQTHWGWTLLQTVPLCYLDMTMYETNHMMGEIRDCEHMTEWRHGNKRHASNKNESCDNTAFFPFLLAAQQENVMLRTLQEEIALSRVGKKTQQNKTVTWQESVKQQLCDTSSIKMLF